MLVRCYWNLHRACWSVQHAQTRRVIGHASRILLREVAFTVSEAGRQRVLEEGRKNVHAFAAGELEAADWIDRAGFCPFDWKLTARANNAYQAAAGKYGRFVSYNPRRGPFFAVQQAPDQLVRINSSPMALLTTTPTTMPRGSKRAALLAFEPCDMTGEESRRATQ